MSNMKGQHTVEHMPVDRNQPKVEVNSPDEIPAFRDECEEHEFWKTHAMGAGMFENVGPIADDELPPVRPRTRPVAIRFDGDTLRRLKAVAAKKGIGYQTLPKQFVLERLSEEEKRDGMLG